jgi:hypothetical protein
MKEIIGAFIITISIAIIALIIWLNHFFMVSFGRGLPEALFYQRLIATIIQSAPFIVCIYLALRSPIFGHSDKKETPVKKKWSPAQIAIGFVCVCIMWPWPSGVLISVYFQLTQKSLVPCSKMETDVQNTAAAISSYYSDPNHIALPSVDQLIEEEYLSTNYPLTIEADANGEPVIIVINDKDDCARGKKLVYYFNGMEPEWKD